MGGIYKITCAANRHLYVGSCKDFSARWQEHRKLLSQNKHFCPTLQTAWNRFGERQFAYSIVERIGDEDASYYLQREEAYIRSFAGKGVLMFSLQAHGCSSRMFSQEQINLKIATTLQYKAASMSVEDRKRLWGVGRKGKPLSNEHKRKMSEQLVGQRRSVETKRAMSIGQKLSFANNPERKRAIREVGRKNVGRIPSNANPYIVDGVEYKSGSHVMKELGITALELQRLVKFGRARRKFEVKEVKVETPRVQTPVYREEYPEDPSSEDGFGLYI